MVRLLIISNLEDNNHIFLSHADNQTHTSINHFHTGSTGIPSSVPSSS